MTANLFSGIPDAIPEEIIETLLKTPAVRIERILSQGQCSPADFWYCQTEHEWVLLLQGQARLSFKDRNPLTMNPGDYVLIPAGCQHRVDWTPEDVNTLWLALFFADTLHQTVTAT